MASGSVAGFQLKKDGSFGDRVAFVQHQGAGVDQKRQKRTACACGGILAGREVSVCARSRDRPVCRSTGVGKDGSLSPADPPFAKIKGGSGPRHFAFHPRGKFAFGLNEMGSSVTAFAYDGKARSGRSELFRLCRPTSKGKTTRLKLKWILLGMFLYASNRGHDSITVFSPSDRNEGTLNGGSACTHPG